MANLVQEFEQIFKFGIELELELLVHNMRLYSQYFEYVLEFGREGL